MAYVDIASTDVDAKSPVDDTLMGLIRTNQIHIEQMLSDGASAPAGLTIDTMTIAGAGTALTVDNDVTITGQLTTGSFFVSDLVQNFEDWA